MQCPNCHSPLVSLDYEGLEIGRCEQCGGEWLDAGALGEIVHTRQLRFNEQQKRSLSAAPRVPGVRLEAVDRHLECPDCGAGMRPLNYGGDSGIIIDRCTDCGGMWLDQGELEKIQVLVEGWEEGVSSDVQRLRPALNEIAREEDRLDDVHVSKLPLVGGLMDSLVNGVIDLGDREPGRQPPPKG